MQQIGTISADICAHAHKPRMPQRQLAQKTDHEIEGNRQKNAVCDLMEHLGVRGLQVARIIEDHQHRENGSDDDVTHVIFGF